MKKSRLKRQRSDDEFNSGISVELQICTFAQTFSMTVKSDTYVDKSLLIYNLFNEESTDAKSSCKKHENVPGIMITAPRCFGKSVNLDMVKCFLEIQCEEETGHVISRQDVKSNYKLFNGLKIMAPKYAEFVEKHFGKYPVIKVNFNCCDSITNLKDAVIFCNKAIHKSFKEHLYLLKSKKLSKDEKDLFNKWISDISYVKMIKSHTLTALEFLSIYLYKHFNSTKVFVLIDNYDSLMNAVISRLESNTCILEQVMNFYFDVLSSLLKGNNYVYGVVVTGISHFVNAGVSSITNTLTTYKFLNNHHFIEFFGFTEAEVNELCKKFHVSHEEQCMLHETYKGYQSKNGKHVIYNPYSVVKYLLNRGTGCISYWVKTGAICWLENAFLHKFYRNIRHTLVKGNYTAVDLKTNFEVENIKEFSALLKKGDNVPTVNVFLSFLLDQGYLSYAGNSQLECALKIPNEEIKKMFVDLVDF